MGNCCNKNINKNFNKLVAKTIDYDNNIINIIIIASEFIEIQNNTSTSIFLEYKNIFYVNKIKKDQYKIVTNNRNIIIITPINFLNWYYDNKRIFYDNNKLYLKKKRKNVYTALV